MENILYINKHNKPNVIVYNVIIVYRLTAKILLRVEYNTYDWYNIIGINITVYTTVGSKAHKIVTPEDMIRYLMLQSDLKRSILQRLIENESYGLTETYP